MYPSNLNIFATDSSFELWYYPLENIFRDVEGNHVYNLHEYFSIPELEAWKRRKKRECLKAKTGQIIELWYPEPEQVEYAKTHSYLVSIF